jgi:hypothetical protein
MFQVKKRAIYRKKLKRILLFAFQEIDSLPAYTADEACKRLRQISYKKDKY